MIKSDWTKPNQDAIPLEQITLRLKDGHSSFVAAERRARKRSSAEDLFSLVCKGGRREDVVSHINITNQSGGTNTI